MNPADSGLEYLIFTHDKGNRFMPSCSFLEKPGGPGEEKKNGSSANTAVMLHACQAKAEQLFGVLTAESEALRHFDSDLLLELIPRKEYSLNVLCEALRALKSSQEFGEQTDDNPSLFGLREILGKIKRHNDANRIFIEGSLNHYQDLLMTILPTVYGQSEGNLTHSIVNCTGVAIRRKA